MEARRFLKPRSVLLVLALTLLAPLAGQQVASAFPFRGNLSGTFTWVAASGGGYVVTLSMQRDLPPITETTPFFRQVESALVYGPTHDVGRCTPEPGDELRESAPWILKVQFATYDPSTRQLSRDVRVSFVHWRGAGFPGGLGLHSITQSYVFPQTFDPNEEQPLPFFGPSQYIIEENQRNSLFGVPGAGGPASWAYFRTRIFAECPPSGDSRAEGNADNSRF